MSSSSNSARLRNRQATQDTHVDRSASMPGHYGPLREIARLLATFEIFSRHRSMRERDLDARTVVTIVAVAEGLGLGDAAGFIISSICYRSALRLCSLLD